MKEIQLQNLKYTVVPVFNMPSNITEDIPLVKTGNYPLVFD